MLKTITRHENNENVPYLENTQVVLVYCNISQQWLSTRFKSLVYNCA